MTREEIIEIFKRVVDKAKDENYISFLPTYMVSALTCAIEELEKEKTGHWIYHKEKKFVCAEHWECSQCHRTTMTYPFRANGNDYDAMYYCPKCGAKMEE